MMQYLYNQFNEEFCMGTVNDLLNYLETSQYKYVHPNKIDGIILTKGVLQQIKPEKGQLVSCTSGTTGTPLMVTKTQQTILWFKATNLRELQWRKWDLTKVSVIILAKIMEDSLIGTTYLKKLEPINKLQTFLEKIQPSYLYTYPSIIKELDLSKLNLIDIKSTGEVDGTCYSAEEVGTIALQCPNYPFNHHIMENIIIEIDPDYGILVTDLTNPLITKYALGDVIEFGDVCPCGRTLKTIKSIKGRVRNMFTLQNGSKIWPLIGEPYFCYITNKIIKHQTIQKSLTDVEVRLLVREILTDSEESSLLCLIKKKLQYFNMKIVYVNEFKQGKFEACISEVI